MALKAPFFVSLFFGFFVSDTCSQVNTRIQNSTVLVGSTPCDPVIKPALQIPAATTCDFIRWELTLEGDGNANTFFLTTVFGESQPNTPGFKGDGEKRTFKGTYTVLKKNKEMPNGEIYLLKTEKSHNIISLLKLNENLFHLLTPSGKLMTGNGGWSYTLNRKEPVTTTALLPSPATSFTVRHETIAQVIFDGRTPCQNFATDHQMNVRTSCFKLKWRLILNRDPATGEPTTYTIRKVVENVPRDVSGKWVILDKIPGNTKAVIYQLDPGKPGESISLLVGDENVLFFLDKKQKLYVGNNDFSYTLNKRQ
jgi:hypothetical protein